MSQEFTPDRRWHSGVACAAWALAAALQLAGATATAGVLVYLNELADGSTIHTVPIEIIANSTPTLELYIVKDVGAPSAPGMGEAICVTPTLQGGETCGFVLKILAEPDLMFETFAMESSWLRTMKIIAANDDESASTPMRMTRLYFNEAM